MHMLLQIFFIFIIGTLGLRRELRVISFDPTDDDSPVILQEAAEEGWILDRQTSTAIIDPDGVRHEFTHMTFKRLARANAA